MVVLGPGLTSIFVALGIAYWLNMARIVRSQILKVKNEEYIIAAEAMGIPKYRILLRHILPNCVTNHYYIDIGHSRGYFTEAFLSFIGLGVKRTYGELGCTCF